MNGKAQTTQTTQGGRIELDRSRLLGFDQVDGGPMAKVGGKPPARNIASIGGKVGGKQTDVTRIGTRIGGKVSVKPAQGTPDA